MITFLKPRPASSNALSRACSGVPQAKFVEPRWSAALTMYTLPLPPSQIYRIVSHKREGMAAQGAWRDTYRRSRQRT
jgi:hypothetical protein